MLLDVVNVKVPVLTTREDVLKKIYYLINQSGKITDFDTLRDVLYWVNDLDVFEEVDPKLAHKDMENFKSNEELDGFKTEYDGVRGALQIAKYGYAPHTPIHVNDKGVVPFDKDFWQGSLNDQDNINDIIMSINSWRVLQQLKLLCSVTGLTLESKLEKQNREKINKEIISLLAN